MFAIGRPTAATALRTAPRARSTALRAVEPVTSALGGVQRRHLRIQLPALNEAATLASVVHDALAAAERLRQAGDISELSLLIIDDGSSDGTDDVARALAAADTRVRVLRHARNRGLGAAFRTGVADALSTRADVLVHLDSDGQFDPSQLGALVSPILDGTSDLVTASRFAGVRPNPPLPPARRVGNAVVAAWVSAASGRALRDASCGFRAYSRELLQSVELSCDYTYTHETLIEAGARGFRVREVPLFVKGVRDGGASRLAPSVVGYGCRAAMGIMRAWWRNTRPTANRRRPRGASGRRA